MSHLENRLIQQFGIDVHLRQVGGHTDPKVHPPGLGQYRHWLHSLWDEPIQRNASWLRLAPLVQQLGKLDHSADQATQSRDLGDQIIQGVPLVGVQAIALMLQDLQCQADGSEGGQQLVRHHAKKRCLQPVQPVQPPMGFLQRLPLDPLPFEQFAQFPGVDDQLVIRPTRVVPSP